MFSKTSYSAVAIAITLGLGGCSPAPHNNAGSKVVAQVSAESQRLNTFFAEVFAADVADSPLRQSYLGIKDDYDKWDDISDAATQTYIEKLQQRLVTAKGFDRTALSETEQLSLDIFMLDIERKLANDAFRHHTYIMHQFRAFHTLVPSFLINIHRVSDSSDATAYVQRLYGVAPMFDQVIDQLRIRETLGVFPPKWSYDQMIQASRNVLKGFPFEAAANDSTIYADFKQKVTALELTDAQTKDLLNRAQDALLKSVQPAYEKLISELTKQRLLSPAGDGVWRLPDGDQWYQNRLEWFTTTDMTAEQVHQVGLDNVARIHNAMRDIMQQVGFEGTLSEFFVFMREDAQFYYDDSDAGRAQYMADAKAYIDAMEAKLPEFFGLIPQAPMIIKRVEAFREKSAGKAFYQSPALDGSRPGTITLTYTTCRLCPLIKWKRSRIMKVCRGTTCNVRLRKSCKGSRIFKNTLVLRPTPKVGACTLKNWVRTWAFIKIRTLTLGVWRWNYGARVAWSSIPACMPNNGHAKKPFST
jgi:uncharacterized protein (DUF885 family)